jgi:hypothetical protein
MRLLTKEIEMTQHTKGPWTYRRVDGIHELLMANVCEMSSTTYYPWVPANPADWKLMAAAPDLLEALQAVIAEHEDGYGLKCVEQVKAAIAKATGEK